MNDENYIAKLEAQVSALQLFVISLIDALPSEVATDAHREFMGNFHAVHAQLISEQRTDAATRLADAVEGVNSRSAGPLYR